MQGDTRTEMCQDVWEEKKRLYLGRRAVGKDIIEQVTSQGSTGFPGELGGRGVYSRQMKCTGVEG